MPHSCFSVRVFRFAFLATLAAGVAIVPFRLAAQEVAPAASPETGVKAPAAPSSEAAKPEGAAKSEQEENNVYRLEGPIVKATAKATHLSLETTARIFEIINFAIVALLIGIPLVRIMPKVIRKRGETVRANLESARKVTEDANSRLSAIESKLAGLDGEIAQIRTQVEEESRQDEVRIKAAFEEESARIVAAAEQEIGVAAAQARRGLRHFAADLAIEQAAKQMTLTPEIDKALIAEFLADASKGGQN